MKKLYCVPPHVRDGFAGRVKSVYGAWDDAEATDAWVFGRRLKKNLQTNAYAKVRPTRSDVLFERFQQTARLQVYNGTFERAYTGEDELLEEPRG